MKDEEKKAAIAAYKERKTVAGIYVMHCLPTGQQWVGKTPDLGAIQNRLWFTLRHNVNPHRTLAAAWRIHGPDNFVIEEIERLDDDEIQAYFREKILKERLSYWRSKLNAEMI